MSENQTPEYTDVTGQLALEAEDMPEPTQTVEIETDRTEFTAYQLHNLINKAFTAAGREDLKIKPQMIYNYARNGLVVKGESVKKGTYVARTYTPEEATAFVTKFVTSRLERKA